MYGLGLETLHSIPIGLLGATIFGKKRPKCVCVLFGANNNNWCAFVKRIFLCAVVILSNLSQK